MSLKSFKSNLYIKEQQLAHNNLKYYGSKI